MTPLTSGDRFAALLVADAEGPGAFAAEQAVAAAGGRVRARIGWAEVAEELPRRSDRAALVLEAEGVGADLLADVLPRLDSVAAALDLPVVACFDRGAIDLVAAALVSARAELLCEPGLGDRAAALALATVAGSEQLREDEGAKLRQLNDEVARIADVLARLAARDQPREEPQPAVADRRQSFEAEPEAEVDPADVRRAIRARRLRDQFFAPSLLEDPGWDMLLDLFAAELERVRVSVSSLCIAAAVPATTALRWIGKMTDAGLFAREADPFDRRRAYLVLSPRAGAAMRAYFGAARRAGLGVA